MEGDRDNRVSGCEDLERTLRIQGIGSFEDGKKQSIDGVERVSAVMTASYPLLFVLLFLTAFLLPESVIHER